MPGCIESTSTSDTIKKDRHVRRKHRNPRFLNKTMINTSSSQMRGVKIEMKSKRKKPGSSNETSNTSAIKKVKKTVIRTHERPKSLNEATTTSVSNTKKLKNPINIKLDKPQLLDETSTSTSSTKIIISVKRKHKVPKRNEIIYNKTSTIYKKPRGYEKHKQPEMYDKKITYLLDSRNKENPVNKKHNAHVECCPLECCVAQPKSDEKQNIWYKLLPKQEDCEEIYRNNFCSTTDTYEEEKSACDDDEYDDVYYDPSPCERLPHRCAATQVAKPCTKPFKRTQFKVPWTCKSWLNNHFERCREYLQFTELNTMQQGSLQPNYPNVCAYPFIPPTSNWKKPKADTMWLWPKTQCKDDYIKSCTPNFLRDPKASPTLFQVLFGAVAVCLCLPCIIIHSLCHVRGLKC